MLRTVSQNLTQVRETIFQHTTDPKESQRQGPVRTEPLFIHDQDPFFQPKSPDLNTLLHNIKAAVARGRQLDAHKPPEIVALHGPARIEGGGLHVALERAMERLDPEESDRTGRLVGVD